MQNLILKSTSVRSDRKEATRRTAEFCLWRPSFSWSLPAALGGGWFQLCSWNTDEVLLPAHILSLSKISQVQSHDRSYNFWQNYGAITFLLKSVCNYSAKRSRDL